MSTVSPSPLLKIALLVDAVVSGLVAALQLGATPWLKTLLLLPAALLQGTGLFLIGWSALLLVLSRATRLSSAAIATIIASNLAWSLACVVMLLGGALQANVLGVAFVMMQAVAVLVFAAAQFMGLRSSSRADVPASPSVLRAG